MIEFGLTPGERTTTVLQDAVRILLLIAEAAEPLPDPPPVPAPEGAVAVLRTQVRLQKLDFWLRNPDYLADELLARFESEGNREDLETARQILESDEPELRSYQMLRHLFGAYEQLDEALAVLRAPGLVVRRKHGSPAHAVQHDYYLTATGRETARQAIKTAPELQYYADRARLVTDLAAGRRGSALRDIQYLQPEYADAAIGEHIASIATRARERLSRALETVGGEAS